MPWKQSSTMETRMKLILEWRAGASNDVVSIDFTGWFRCRDGKRVDPLTIIDKLLPLPAVVSGRRRLRLRACETAR